VLKENQTNFDILDPELQVLQNIYTQEDHVRQRDLAKIAGLSLGMTNAIVKRLVEKGWLTIRKVNNRNIRYAVSGAGIEQISRRSYRYFKRTIKNIVYYREGIEAFVRDVKAHGYTSILLNGRSDLDFIVEHACGVYGVEYVRDERDTGSTDTGKNGLFILYSESYIPDNEEKARIMNAAFLQEVVSAGADGRHRGEDTRHG
jgi:DNA-binding MarR family transcriptional regulator